MATNIIQKGTGIVLQITAGAAYDSGDAILIGEGLVGICLEDIASAATGSVMVGEGIVIDYPVKGHNGSGNHAVVIGDLLSFDGSDAFFDVTPGTSATNKIVGYALEAVTSGATATIEVLLIPNMTGSHSADLYTAD